MRGVLRVEGAWIHGAVAASGARPRSLPSWPPAGPGPQRARAGRTARPEHLVTVADLDDDGFRLPRQTPAAEDGQPFTCGGCHGPTGTRNLVGALELGVCLTGCAGFWVNDGRCGGTAGVLDAVPTQAPATGHPHGRVFADGRASIASRGRSRTVRAAAGACMTTGSTARNSTREWAGCTAPPPRGGAVPLPAGPW